MNGNGVFVLIGLAFISVYSFLNYYFIRKHNAVVTLGLFPTILFWLIVITFILTPMATMVFSQHGPPFMAAVTGFTGYSWLAFLFLFLAIHGSADLLLFIVGKIGVTLPAHTDKGTFLLTLGCSIFILLFGWYEAGQIRSEKLRIETSKLPAQVEKLIIAQLSDIHFSPIIGKGMSKKLLDIVQAESPDLVVVTGDLLDQGVRDREEVISHLSQMNGSKGKYAITGNHEFYAGIRESTDFIQQSGFRFLRNEALTVEEIINIVGVDDPTAERFGMTPAVSESNLLAGVDQNKFTLLLKHQPRIDKKAAGLFDLQLSGHTHAGQIFPFTILVKLAFPYLCGLYELNGGGKLYVSRGAGTWGPPFRFLAPPEVTIIELVRKP
jgi:uncharacterized protein